MTGIFYSLFVIGLVLSAADGILTVLVLANGGIERNPLYAWAFRKMPAALVLTVTKTAMAYALYRAVRELLARGEHQAALGVLAFAIILFGYLTIRNALVRRAQG